MTFEDVKKFAIKKGLKADEYGIRIRDYTLYEAGYIYLYTSSIPNLAMTFLIAEKRTPEQMKYFIESLL